MTMGTHMSIMGEAKILEIFSLYQVESNPGGKAISSVTWPLG